MKTLFAFLLIVFLVFASYRLTFKDLKLPFFARSFLLTGNEFLFIGVLLGPLFLGVLDPPTLSALDPLGALVLGGIGLLFGLQFEIRKLARVPADYFRATGISAGITFAVVLAGTWTIFSWFGATVSRPILPALVLAAAGVCTSQGAIALWGRKAAPGQKKIQGFLRYLASLDGVPALLFYAALFALPGFPGAEEISGPPVSGALAGVAVLAAVGLVFLLLMNSRMNEMQLVLVVMGTAVLASGAAQAIGFSPLAFNFLLGVLAVNVVRDKERVFGMLVAVEKPAYLLLLVFLGALWRPGSIWLLAGAAAYLGLRAAGRMASGLVVTRSLSLFRGYPASVGMGLIGQGGMGLAIFYDYARLGGDGAEPLLTLALAALVLTDLVSPFLLRVLLEKEGT